MLPNRIAIYLTTAAGIATAIAPAVADLDTTSTASLIAGFLGIAGIVHKFLEGWQRYEERSELADLAELDVSSVSPPA